MHQEQGLRVLIIVAMAVCLVYCLNEVQSAIPVDAISLLNSKFDKNSEDQLATQIADFDSCLYTEAYDSFDIAAELAVQNQIRIEKELSNYTGLNTMNKFYESLFQAKQKKGQSRVAWFGDSVIEGDLITQHARDSLQKMFGGSGVGWVPIVSPSSRYRASVRHTFSKDWNNYSMVSEKSETHPFGIAGDVSTCMDSSKSYEDLWVNYKATKYLAGSSVFPSLHLFYANSDNLKAAEVKVVSGNITHGFPLEGRAKINRLELLSQNCKEVNLSFNIGSHISLFGVSMESSTGLILDNFASRGNSGLTYTGIPCSVLHSFQQKMGYDLVVLQFGLNVVSNTNEYDWYEIGMDRVLKHLRSCLPNADFLIVSVADKGKRIDGEIKTDPAIPTLVEIQKKLAHKHQIAFFNLFDAMGGENSMPKWVEQTPRLANKDYTHFSPEGAKKVASLITDFLMDGFNRFEKEKQESAIIEPEVL